METPGIGARRLLAIASQTKLRRILQKMLDETEFLSPRGIRALSKIHDERPYIFDVNGATNTSTVTMALALALAIKPDGRDSSLS
jgi:hypothetical protein